MSDEAICPVHGWPAARCPCWNEWAASGSPDDYPAWKTARDAAARGVAGYRDGAATTVVVNVSGAVFESPGTYVWTCGACGRCERRPSVARPDGWWQSVNRDRTLCPACTTAHVSPEGRYWRCDVHAALVPEGSACARCEPPRPPSDEWVTVHDEGPRGVTLRTRGMPAPSPHLGAALYRALAAPAPDPRPLGARLQAARERAGYARPIDLAAALWPGDATGETDALRVAWAAEIAAAEAGGSLAAGDVEILAVALGLARAESDAWHAANGSVPPDVRALLATRPALAGVLRALARDGGE